MMRHYIGVDVGTGSVRAAIVSEAGELMATSVAEITTWNRAVDHYEQSSDNIWSAVTTTVKSVLETSGVDKDQVRGVGFDGTCSLVVLDQHFQPVSVSKSGRPECNVILWMDHRAATQANTINQTGSSVLQYVGGRMSLEMQMPKLCWLKQNLKDQCWNHSAHFFDLPDFLTWRATHSMSRSLCTLVCKWGYVAGTETDSGWNGDFFKKIGLEDLIHDNYSKIGSEVRAPGEACGNGLTREAAEELGLNPGTPVGTALIDAHAGGVGCLGCVPSSLKSPLPAVTGRLVLICGTSSCHMAISKSAIFVGGVWGPYYSAMLPEHWLNEGGQSATGKLIDFVIESHPAYQEALSQANKSDVHIHSFLNSQLEVMTDNKGGQSVAQLTADLHIWPDFHGNRSPIADPSLKGMVCGLTLSSGIDNLALIYLATVQALTYGTRHIISEMNRSGHSISLVYLCGGLRNNQLFVTTTADILNMPVVLPDNTESVLLGSAILGARASGDCASIQDAMGKMGGKGSVVMPDKNVHQYHDKKYQVYLKMLEHQREYTQIMAQ
ncbi:FGGY carbohydrate kinase domain-containing protein-like [Haliotis rubra]|uniref:FGGY carbohydrate kinase domain-containing protein-like n=1 Tax=Haliotis rubra TaxID=36100 RepID=UPI001EE5F82F|nr:FGGY carbohydrate kinase domain-containing protein-like [Haliotis rubra]XP_046544874.1 FGGY carbohydrate kinase domain-containing protein-like [Haliotis rubra]